MSFYNPDYYSFDNLSSDYGSTSSPDLYSFAFTDPSMSNWYGDSLYSDPSSWTADTPDWLSSFQISPQSFSFDSPVIPQSLTIDDTPIEYFSPKDFDYGNFIGELDDRLSMGQISPADYDFLKNQAEVTDEAQQESESELSLGSRLAQQYLSPLAMSYDPIRPMRTSFLGADHPVNRPSQSYLDREGNVVGLVDPGADFQNPYEYRVGPSGDTFIQDIRNGLVPGFLGEDMQPTLYSEVRDQNLAAARDEGFLSKAAREIAKLAQSRGQSGQSGQQRSGTSGGGSQGTASSPSVASGALNALSAALAALNAMKKDSGVDRSELERASNVQDLGPRFTGTRPIRTLYMKKGGKIPDRVDGGLSALALRIAQEVQRLDEMKDEEEESGKINGEGGGQDDVVDVRAAPGEYVFDAEIVSALGDGNTDEGARKLDRMRENIRKHKRSAGHKNIPPKAKSIEQYLKG